MVISFKSCSSKVVDLIVVVDLVVAVPVDVAVMVISIIMMPVKKIRSIVYDDDEACDDDFDDERPAEAEDCCSCRCGCCLFRSMAVLHFSTNSS